MDLSSTVDDEMSMTSWVTDVDTMKVGTTYHVFLTDVDCLGIAGDAWIFTGVLDHPRCQLSMCCFAGECVKNSHGECAARSVKAKGTRVNVLVPFPSFAACETAKIHSACLFAGKYEGFRSEIGDDANSIAPTELDVSDVSMDMSRNSSVEMIEVLPHFHLFSVKKECSLFLPRCTCDSETWFHIELFSGAFAGWRQATMLMKELGFQNHGSLAVEIDKEVAELLQRNFQIQHFLDEDDPLFKGFAPLYVGDHTHDVVFRGSADNPGWMLLLPWCSKLIATVSAPCPPWSSASERDGLHDDDGMVFIRTLALLRFVQPAAIAIENVEPLRFHRHFMFIEKMLAWIGYRIVWEKCSDLKMVAPTTRKRWLAVCIPVDSTMKATTSFELCQLPGISLRSFRSFVELPPEHEHELTLDENAIRIYGNKAFAGHLGHMVVGNCIATPHALLALAVLRAYVDSTIRVHPVEVVNQAMKLRLHSENAEIRMKDDMIWIVKKGSSVPDDANEQKPNGDGSDIPPTIPFRAEYSLQISGALGVHSFFHDGTSLLLNILESNGIDVDTEMCACTRDGDLVRWNRLVDEDLSLFIDYFDPHVVRLLENGTSWLLALPVWSARQLLEALPEFSRFQNLLCLDIVANEVDLDVEMEKNEMVLFLPQIPNFSTGWKIEVASDLENNAFDLQLKLHLPEVRRCASFLQCRIFGPGASTTTLPSLKAILSILQPVLSACRWNWEPCDDDNLILGHIRPNDDDAAPSLNICFPLLRAAITGFLDNLRDEAGIPMRIKYDDVLLWEGHVKHNANAERLVRALQVILTHLGWGPSFWVCSGKMFDFKVTVAELPLGTDDVIRLFGMPKRAGGGGKIDVWKECKSLLGKELIQKGWQLSSLDDVTTQWLQAIGTNKVFAIMKQQLSADQRWRSLTEAAKWQGLPTTPGDPVKLRAARTIQKAVRRTRKVQLVENEFKISPGFFTRENDGDLPILSTMGVNQSGICLVTWEEAQQWIGRTLPLIPEELAIISFVRDDVPKDVINFQEVTFPALDRFGRRVLLKGMLWQLGAKCVKMVSNNHTIVAPPTLVVAVTVWKDECTPSQWESICVNPVKTVMNMFDEDDPSLQPATNVLQVWGRSFRDERVKVEPAAALSVQFHMRIFMSKAESFLKLSGKHAAYLTPKDDQQKSHASWGLIWRGLIWLGDKVDADIAAGKATEHSGLARARNKFALRVRAPIMEQIVKEVRPNNTEGVFPTAFLFKLEPIPVGIISSQLVAWADQLKWKIKVLKRLGQTSYLIGSPTQPPSEEDSWAVYRMMKGLPTGPQTVAASAPSSGSKTLDGPVQAKFAELEQKLLTVEATVQQVATDSAQVTKHVESTNQRLTHVEKQIGAMPQDLMKAVENAMSRGMKAQESRLDSKFQSILDMLNSGPAPKRGLEHNKPDNDGDQPMESPVKEPVLKK
eukprot:Skav214312  [mRNA]  locus=scaffold998:175880:180590:- [translate_table: standard]